MSKTIYFLLISIFINAHALAQAKALDSISLKNIFDKMLDDYLPESDLTENAKRVDNCIRDTKEGYYLTCIEIQWDVDWQADFDKDGNMDTVIRVLNSGMGGGGNMYGYTINILLLNADQTIKNNMDIFSGGKFSESSLDIQDVRNDTIYLTYEQTWFSDTKKDHDDLISLDLELVYKNGKIQSKHYQKCPISIMDKTIFKKDLPYLIERKSDIDESFEVTQIEVLKITNEPNYYAYICGCTNIYLHFGRKLPYTNDTTISSTSILKEFLNYVDFLVHHTRYKTVLAQLHNKLQLLDTSKIQMNSDSTYTFEIQLKNKWSALLEYSKRDKKIFIEVSLKRIEKELNEDFWLELQKKITKS
ncbi:MAG: hypothetical protein OIF50_08850 [Flavobacteriaceae bacterium]|nr:hypothetical protein [Flavobacteriaceae bacterium]